MPEVSGYALVAAVQAVDEKVWRFKDQIDAMGEDDDASDLEDEMMGFIKAAESLRASYEAAVKSSLKLPPYESLIRE